MPDNNGNRGGLLPGQGWETDLLELPQAPNGAGGAAATEPHFTVHWPDPSLNSTIYQQTYPTTVDLSQAFHTYQLVWEPGQITMLLDGVIVAEVGETWLSSSHTIQESNSATLPNGPAPIYDLPMYLIINNQVGAVGSFSNPQYTITSSAVSGSNTALTLASAPPSYFTTGVPVTIAGVTGSGATAVNGTQTIVSVVGNVVTVSATTTGAGTGGNMSSTPNPLPNSMILESVVIDTAYTAHTLIGMYSGDSAVQSESDAATYLHVLGAATNRPLQSNYWPEGVTATWANMNNSYLAQVVGAKSVVMSMPILMGVQPTFSLSSNLVEGTEIFSIGITAAAAVNGISSGTIVPAGANITILDGSHQEVITITQEINVGDLSIVIAGGWTPSFSYRTSAPATVIYASGVTICSTNPAGSATPCMMTLNNTNDGAYSIVHGDWDTQWNTFGGVIATWLAAQSPTPTFYNRLAWEHYGSAAYYPWSGPGCGADLQLAWEHVVPILQTHVPSMLMDWSGGITVATLPAVYDPSVNYPTSSQPAVISCDVYDQQSPGGTLGWNYYANLMEPYVALAVEKGVGYGIVELGLASDYGIARPPAVGGVGDDPQFLIASYYWARATSVLTYLTFYNPIGDTDLADNPNCAAVFSALFGAWSLILNGATEYAFLTAAGEDLLFV